MTVDISAAQKIDGWMSDAELTWLAEQAQTHQRIVEIGSWKGRSTYALAHTPGSVIAVDHWRGQELTAEPTQLDREIQEKGSDTIFEEFRSNIAPVSEKINTARMSSSEAAEDVSRLIFKTLVLYDIEPGEWPNVGPDMVFLDGEHAYEGVSNDIALWKPLLKPGGLLCGHDWWHEGIKRAVKEAVKGYQVVPNTNIWWAIV